MKKNQRHFGVTVTHMPKIKSSAFVVALVEPLLGVVEFPVAALVVSTGFDEAIPENSASTISWMAVGVPVIVTTSFVVAVLLMAYKHSTVPPPFRKVGPTATEKLFPAVSLADMLVSSAVARVSAQATIRLPAVVSWVVKVALVALAAELCCSNAMVPPAVLVGPVACHVVPSQYW